jgi:Zn-dependent peptidase ImmA (M78 family)
LIAALVGGCAAKSSDDTLQVVYDVCEPIALVPGAGADAAELASLDAAIEMWNALGQTRLSRATASSERSQRTLEVRFETAAAVFYGVYDDERGLVFINHRLADHEQRAVTIAHELGHAFGLFHISDRVSVMNPQNLDVEPTAEDAADLTALWGDCPSS